MKYIVKEPIDLPEILSEGHHKKAGAVVLFSGEARNHHHGKDVSHLEYEAYEPLANKMVQEILEEAKTKWELHFAICVHRVGRVDICESAVVVVTSSSHRKEAYEANQFIINKVKHEVPIWKKEYFVDGSHKWGNNCDCGLDHNFDHQHEHHSVITR